MECNHDWGNEWAPSWLGYSRDPRIFLRCRRKSIARRQKSIDEQSTMLWQAMQNARNRESSQRVRLETPSVHAIRDDSPLLCPGKSSVVNGQLEPGLMLNAVR